VCNNLELQVENISFAVSARGCLGQCACGMLALEEEQNVHRGGGSLNKKAFRESRTSSDARAGGGKIAH